MTTPQDNSPQSSNTETDIWNAISAFERILEAIPSDRVSLEALTDAYEHVGDHTRAKEYILRLARVLINDDDEEAARDLLRKLKRFADDPKAAALISEIESFRTEKVMADVIDADEMAAPRAANLSDEIAFAWNLFQNSKLSQEEYSSVVQDLTETSSRKHDTPVSTLHVLQDRNFKNMTDVMIFVAKDCGTPILSLANFELQPAAFDLLTIEFCINRKALPFDTIGNDILVAVLNPYDTNLKTDLETLTGRICHFFLLWPSDFDMAIEIKKKADAEPA